MNSDRSESNGLNIPPLLSIVSPVYGCAGCIESLVDRIEKAVLSMNVRHEIILVDDCGPDDSWLRIKELSLTRRNVVGIRLSRNFGQHAAISAGLKACRGDVVVVMDCDLQDVPEEIPNLVAALDEQYDVAVAQRIDRQDSRVKRLASIGFYAVLSWLTGVKQDHTVANFGAYRKIVIESINAMPEANRFFPLMVKWTGFPSIKVPVKHDERGSGRSSYSLGAMIKLALDVAISYSDKPLRMMVSIGVVFSIIAGLVVAYSLFQYFTGNTAVAGFTSIIASIWLVGGATQISAGIIGLYLGRVYVEAKARPAFLIAQTAGLLGDPDER